MLPNPKLIISKKLKKKEAKSKPNMILIVPIISISPKIITLLNLQNFNNNLMNNRKNKRHLKLKKLLTFPGWE
jgi:hypothetical protein